ncbi:MAG TPA: hypothetical protein DEF45_14570 [Rhodopirellula sp.]|nr:hypothetical protein [Rhodopirellula sp.]
MTNLPRLAATSTLPVKHPFAESSTQRVLSLSRPRQQPDRTTANASVTGVTRTRETAGAVKQWHIKAAFFSVFC